VCAFTFSLFLDVRCLGLTSESIKLKCRYQSAKSDRQPRSSAKSSDADVDCKTTVTEAAASPQTPSAVDVVASMHSYAMPRYIGKSTNGIPRRIKVEAASCEDDHESSNNESEAADTKQHTVSHFR